MILNEHVKFAKAFYQRPYIASSRDESNVSKDAEDFNGGRVTELCARPFLMFLIQI